MNIEKKGVYFYELDLKEKLKFFGYKEILLITDLDENQVKKTYGNIYHILSFRQIPEHLATTSGYRREKELYLKII